MGPMRGSTTCILVAMVLACTLSLGGVDANLSYGYYDYSCPRVEYIVFEAIQAAYQKDNTVAPGILRLIFHDCFVRGCDASVLIAGTTTERAAPVNIGMHGFEAIDAAKAAVEAVCPGVVSCADILAFASRDAVRLTQGEGWAVPAGRRDGRVSLESEPAENLPPPTFTSPELVKNFAAKGLDAEEMVILSGSHTIGVTHCFFLSDRIFSPNIDPTLPKPLLAQLQNTCPNPFTLTPLVIDRHTVNIFDTRYYSNIVSGYGLMTSDQDLYRDPNTRGYVLENLHQSTFNRNFARAMVAMTNIGPKTGSQGEIRQHCQFVNP